MGNLGMRSKTGVLCFTLRTEFPLEFFFYQNLNTAKDTEASSVVFFSPQTTIKHSETLTI